MAGDPNAAARSDDVQRALSVVELGTQAAKAYDRPDLVDRLSVTRWRLADPSFHVFVVGEFKQGKSSLVNALLNAPVCPVDDDIATAVPTAIHYGTEPSATLLLKPAEDEDVVAPTSGIPATSIPAASAHPDDLVREEITVEQVARHVTEAASPREGLRVHSVEVTLPRKVLADGLVVVDTPGVGGLGSAHSAATLGALPMADAVIFVTDASQELTAPELDFLQLAREMCSKLLVVLTKVDFYPAWRKIRDLDVAHLAEHGVRAPVVCVSSALRIHSLRTNDRELNRESGFPQLVGYLQQDIAANAEKITVRNAASDVLSVASLLTAQFQNERQALESPEGAAAVVANLAELKERSNQLRGGAAKWHQALSDGIVDLQGDLDYELRARLREVTKLADDAIDNSDPAETWDDFQAWLYRRVAADIIHTYTSLHQRAQELALRVAESFGEDGGEMAVELDLANPADVVAAVEADTSIKAEKMGMSSQGLAALRGSYGGMLMFGMLGRVAGLGLINPATVVIGLFLGRKALRDEKERQRAMRRSQAKQAHRKYTDEVGFVVGKDARDTLRRIQRQLRDFFAGRADELHRSTTDAMAAAQKAARSDKATRQTRLRDVRAELERIAQVRAQALELAPELRRAPAAASASRPA